jgi:hypothetical protein
VAWQWRKKR